MMTRSNISQSNTLVELTCSMCHNTFTRTLRVQRIKKWYGYQETFCSPECHAAFRRIEYTHVKCAWCSTDVLRRPDQAKKYTNSFCSRSCSAKHTILNRKPIENRSKLEKILGAHLTKTYPGMCLFNDRKTIKLELDIYVPSHRVAIELNGPVHYTPIYTPEKLEYVKNNDDRKVLLCIENKIHLYVIDTSSMNKVTETTAKPYIDKVCGILDKHGITPVTSL